MDGMSRRLSGLFGRFLNPGARSKPAPASAAPDRGPAVSPAE
jgi:hypothetical protein